MKYTLEKDLLLFLLATFTFLSGCYDLNTADAANTDPDGTYVGNADRYNPPRDKSVQPLLCPDSSELLFNEAMSPSRWGDKEVDVRVDVVADFRCPYCAIFATAMTDLWKRRSDYRNKVRVYFHHFPLENSHPGTTEIHVASAAVANQDYDAFWSLHDEIFSQAMHGKRMSRSALEKFVDEKLGLDMDRFESDMTANATKDFVQWDREQGVEIGIAGTPSVFVCGQYLVNRGALEDAIDSFLDASD
jgi:protein-disulfide isomerase